MAASLRLLCRLTSVSSSQMTIFSLTSPDSLAVTFGVVGHLMKGHPRAQVDNYMIGPNVRSRVCGLSGRG